MIDNRLLEEAIADAKAVRATAIANAKQALEEAFSGKFAEMFGENPCKEHKIPDRNITIHILKN
jgi:hypothetical protein